VQRIICDILVVGSGASGLMAAIHAGRLGARVAIVTKGRVLRCGATVMAPGALAAVDDRWKHPQDSKELHEIDTLKGGEWINNQKLVRQMVQQAGECVMDLERMGALFSRSADGTKPDLRIEGGHSFHRSPYMENRVGREMMRALFGEISRLHIPVYEEVMVTELLTEQGRVEGAAGFALEDQEVMLFECGAVILATGGAGILYRLNDNPVDLTGDGYALALRSGAALTDMEFVQGFPLGFAAPEGVRGVIACYPFLAHLYNHENERFAGRYDPRLELTTRDRLSRAILTEVREGRGSPNGGVYCDLTHFEPGYIENNYPHLFRIYRHIGVDPQHDRFEVTPTCHYFMGGAAVDENWQTEVDGLYSVGEAAAGVNGANRVGQNALTDLLVSAKVAGRHAAENRGSRRNRPLKPAAAAEKVIEKITGLLHSKTGLSPAVLRAELGETMHKEAFLLRDEASLLRAQARIRELSACGQTLVDKGSYCNRELLLAMENENLLLTANAVVQAALIRTESRGAHFRSDYPQRRDDLWLQNILLYQKEDGLQTLCRPVDLSYYKPEEDVHD